MLLPRADHAHIDLRKLTNYCLDLHHSTGGHKARVFRSALGIGAQDAVWLREQILAGVRLQESEPLTADGYGRRFRVDVSVSRQERQAVVRTIWILESEVDIPRLVTCWVR